MKKFLVLVSVMFVAAAGAFAMESFPVKLSLINPLYIPKVDKVTGINIGVISSKTGTVWGLDGSWIVDETDETIGLQGAAILSKSNKKITGVQWSLVNFAEEVVGVQFGFWNSCEKMQGIQLGLINHIKSSKALPWMVFINGQF